MIVELTIRAEVTFTSGKFASKADIAEALAAEVEGMDPGTVSLDEAEYEVTEWTVEHDQ